METLIDALKYLIVKDQIEANNRESFTFDQYLENFKNNSDAQELIRAVIDARVLSQGNVNANILDLLIIFQNRRFSNENLETFIKRMILARRNYFDQKELDFINNISL